MSNSALAWAWETPLKSGPKVVLVALADHESRENRRPHPGIKRIAQRTGLTERAVTTHLATLEEAGLISVEKRAGTGRWPVNVYTLAVPEKYRALDEKATGQAGQQERPLGHNFNEPQTLREKYADSIFPAADLRAVNEAYDGRHKSHTVPPPSPPRKKF